MFEHIDMLSIGIQQQPNTVLRALIGSDFGVRVYLWSQHECDYVMVETDSHLKLISTSTLHIYKEFEHIDMLCIIGIQ